MEGSVVITYILPSHVDIGLKYIIKNLYYLFICLFIYYFFIKDVISYLKRTLVSVSGV